METTPGQGVSGERQRAWATYIERVSQRDTSALASLYDESSSLVYGVALRIVGNPADAETVTLDVYEQVWRTAGEFDRGRGSPLTWLVLIARSRAIDRARTRSSNARTKEPAAAVPEPSSSAEWINTDRRTARQAMLALSADQRQLVELAFFSGFSLSQLAAHLNLTPDAVRARIRLAMLKLKEELARAGNTPIRSGHGA
jgi:RNA polymerase sigma-70 factor (ECF subfamily)